MDTAIPFVKEQVVRRVRMDRFKRVRLDEGWADIVRDFRRGTRSFASMNGAEPCNAETTDQHATRNTVRLRHNEPPPELEVSHRRRCDDVSFNKTDVSPRAFRGWRLPQ